MEKYLKWFKEHPLETSALVIVGIGAVYLILTRSQSSAAPAQSGASSASDYYAAQLQAQQVAAGASNAAAQLQTQEYTSNLQATVTNNETAAQLAAIQDQDSSAVQTAQIQANANTAITQVQANVSLSDIQAQQNETLAQTEAELETNLGAYQVQNQANNDTLAATTAQINGQVTQQQIAADVANHTTDAQVQENADNLASVLGLVTSQNNLQESEYSDQLQGLENNNATQVSLSGQQYAYANNELNDATAINLTQLSDATTLETQAQQNQLNLYQEIIPLAGQQKNSALDATDQTSLFQTILAGGNAGVAVAGDSVSGSSVISGNNQAAGILGTVAKPISSILTGLFA